MVTMTVTMTVVVVPSVFVLPSLWWGAPLVRLLGNLGVSRAWWWWWQLVEGFEMAGVAFGMEVVGVASGLGSEGILDCVVQLLIMGSLGLLVPSHGGVWEAAGACWGGREAAVG